MFTKTYISDGVYAAVDEYGAIVLTTENGITTTNRIVLEPEVLTALELFIEHCRALALGPQPAPPAQETT